MERQIIYVDIDNFFTAVEVLKNNKYKGLPIGVGSNGDRGIVNAVSEEAKKYGLYNGIATRMARQLCPALQIVRGNMDDYNNFSNQVSEVIKESVPVMEKAGIDEHYIDMTGMDKFFGTMKFAQELRKKVLHETGLPVSFGLSINKSVSKMATREHKPNGEAQVAGPQVQPFLNPLSVRKLPGIGDTSYMKLSEMGVRLIETMIQVPAEMMYKMLGQNGISLWQKANGIDNSPVIPCRESKSVSRQKEFDNETIDIQKINELLTLIVTDLAFELRAQQKLASCITVTIRYANFETVTKQAKIAYTSLDFTLIQKAKELFDKAYDRRMLLRLIGVRLSNLAAGFEQTELYNTAAERYNLYQAMDKLKNRFGKSAVLPSIFAKKPPERDVSECSFPL